MTFILGEFEDIDLLQKNVNLELSFDYDCVGFGNEYKSFNRT